jgi:isopenicillin N synthase-like dioxygenase
MDSLPIIDLSIKQNPATISRLRQALRKYGAFRLWAPELKQAVTGGLLRDVGFIFLMPTLPFSSR